MVVSAPKRSVARRVEPHDLPAAIADEEMADAAKRTTGMADRDHLVANDKRPSIPTYHGRITDIVPPHSELSVPR
jgi:hypothetical protein